MSPSTTVRRSSADPSAPLTPMEHVPALDGLRAIAVVLVVLFHLQVPGAEAGYVGVDVFFVISGFLITSLLLNEVQRSEHVNLARFWARRARRLLPALAVVTTVVAVVTLLTATFSEKEMVRGDLLATTFYVANWHFISTTSYFSNIGVESPLLHTWSLAIEEQFYLAWPLVVGVLASIFGRRRGPLVAATVAGIALSVGLLAIRWSPDAVDRAYMGTDSRIFEPLIGALGAALLMGSSVRLFVVTKGPVLAILGTLGMVVAIAAIRADPFLYYVGGAVALCAFTLMVVLAVWVQRAGAVGRILTSAPFVWVGLISYGVYLWHWPLALWLGARDPSVSHLLARKVIVVVATVSVAALSFYLVERPIRRRLSDVGERHVSRRRVAVTLVAVPAVLLSVAGIGVASTRVPPITPESHVVMLTGDSVPQRLSVELEKALAPLGWRLVSATHGACPVTGEMLLDASGSPMEIARVCPAEVQPSQDELLRADQPDVVIWWDRFSISGFRTANGEDVTSGSDRFWQLRRAALVRTAERFQADGAVLVFVATEPPGQALEADGCSGGRCLWLQFQVDHYADVTTKWNAMLQAFAAQEGDRALFVDLTPAVCRSPVPYCDDSIDGIPARFDGVHYGEAGSNFVVGVLIDRLARILSASG